ncbi:MAG: DEAD/DEAH box helicase [Ignisphaera sp.]|uniref:DEAD/DEAH box helicase n=1 Tax=Ignisphaera aggregans TaxID=334771 RepID=A0A832CU58_9CREN
MVLIFRIKYSTTTFYLSDLENIADKIRHNNYVLFRLNPVKVIKYGVNNAFETLSNIGVYVPEEIRKLIENLAKDPVDVYIDYDDTGLILYTHSHHFVNILMSKKIIFYDNEKGLWRFMPKELHKVLNLALENNYRWRTSFNLDYKVGLEFRLNTSLREYQEEAYKRWREKGCRGVVVLPVAAGKTLIALKAIEDLKMKTLILVPTIDLLHQWRDNVSKFLGIPRNNVAIYGGGKHDIGYITVMTYDSATLNLYKYFNFFGFIVADECHHAVSQSYRTALTMITAPCRLGLTATPFRSNGLHKFYDGIIGPIVYILEKEDLQTKGYLANHREDKIYVELSKEELDMYKEYMKIYIDFCRKRFPGVKDPKKKFQLILKFASRDSEAREALRAKHRARKIALSTDRKIEIVEKLLSMYKGEKILIFSRYTDIIKKISRQFLIPRILHDTPEEERKKYLDMFRRGEISILATAMALDEGVDVPDASVAIVVSGTGSYREYIQRLGRILRPKNKEALLIEIITKKTIEPSLSRRRRKFEMFNGGS